MRSSTAYLLVAHSRSGSALEARTQSVVRTSLPSLSTEHWPIHVVIELKPGQFTLKVNSAFSSESVPVVTKPRRG